MQLDSPVIISLNDEDYIIRDDYDIIDFIRENVSVELSELIVDMKNDVEIAENSSQYEIDSLYEDIRNLECILYEVTNLLDDILRHRVNPKKITKTEIFDKLKDIKYYINESL